MTDWESSRLHRTAVVVAAMLAAFGLALLAVWLTDGNKADLAGWVEAIATLAALGGAVLAALLLAQAVRIELNREEQRLQHDRSSQAALVAAWPGRISENTGELDEVTGFVRRVGIDNVQVHLRNASAIPVTDVTIAVKVRIRHGDAPTEGDLAWPSGDGYHNEAVLPPGDEVASVWVGLEHVVPYPDGPVPDSMVLREVIFAFTDAVGHRWVRDQNGLH